MTDKKKTKSVDGKEHGAEDFAYAPNPDDPSTWKFPIFDAKHARLAWDLFKTAKDIPAADKPKILAKIKAACKKFGIDISDDSLPRNVERRVVQFPIEARKAEDGSRKFRGTAVVFNQLSENLGGFREQIDPAAFDEAEMSDVRLLFNHDDSLVLGRTKSGTLQLTRDAKGLHFEADPPDTTVARDLATSMDRGDIDQCSFSFTVAPGGADWDQDPDSGSEIRTVKKISRLYDVSIVTYPAYPQTSSELRSNAEILSERQAASHSEKPAEGGVDMQFVHCRMRQAAADQLI